MIRLAVALVLVASLAPASAQETDFVQPTLRAREAGITYLLFNGKSDVQLDEGTDLQLALGYEDRKAYSQVHVELDGPAFESYPMPLNTNTVTQTLDALPEGHYNASVIVTMQNGQRFHVEGNHSVTWRGPPPTILNFTAASSLHTGSYFFDDPINFTATVADTGAVNVTLELRHQAGGNQSIPVTMHGAALNASHRFRAIGYYDAIITARDAMNQTATASLNFTVKPHGGGEAPREVQNVIATRPAAPYGFAWVPVKGTRPIIGYAVSIDEPLNDFHTVPTASWDVAGNLSAGRHDLRVRALDSGGFWGPTVLTKFTILADGPIRIERSQILNDATPVHPPAPTAAPDTGSTLRIDAAILPKQSQTLGEITWTLTGAEEDLALVDCVEVHARIGGQTPQLVDCSKTASTTKLAGLPLQDGDTLRIELTIRLQGNRTAGLASLGATTIDRTPPDVTAASILEEEDQVTIALPGGAKRLTVALRGSTGPRQSFDATCSPNSCEVRIPKTAIQHGDVLVVEAEDEAGNTGSKALELSVTARELETGLPTWAIALLVLAGLALIAAVAYYAIKRPKNTKARKAGKAGKSAPRLEVRVQDRQTQPMQTASPRNPKPKAKISDSDPVEADWRAEAKRRKLAPEQRAQTNRGGRFEADLA